MKPGNGEAKAVEPIARDRLVLREGNNYDWRLDAVGYPREALEDPEFWLTCGPKLHSFDRVTVIGADWIAEVTIDFAEPGRAPIAVVERVRDRRRHDDAREMSALPRWLSLQFDEQRREFVIARAEDGVVLVRHGNRLTAIQQALSHASVRARLR